jgi:preprotein translocase subunit SecF
LIIAGIAIFGFNWGVDFAGGTVVEVKFDYSINAEQVRKAAVKGGLHEPTVQGIGSADENSFFLRMGGVTQLTPEGAARAEAAIKSLGPDIKVNAPDLDNGIINFRSKSKLDEDEIKKLIVGSGTGVNKVRALGEAYGAKANTPAPAVPPTPEGDKKVEVVNEPKPAEAALAEQANGPFDYQVVFAGMSEKVQEALRAGLENPKFEVRRVDYVGPQVGQQLRNKGIMALLYATLAILVYVAFRFDLKFGPGAMVAMVHDVIMVAGYFLVSRREFNLTSIAVLLTIVGYSINDTIVIYDRIREEMARYKGKPLPEIINIAVNDTLARTILTSGVTALSLIGLLIFGVGEIFDFAAAMLVGIIVGTYSSVYIASPLTIWLDEREAARGGRKPGSSMKATAA